MSTRHVVMFSAGAGSWGAAKRVAEHCGTASLTLLFTDTLSEDEDAYRFLVEGAADIFGVELPSQLVPRVEQFPDFEDRAAYKLFVDGLRLDLAASGLLPGLAWIAEGRDIWDVFFAERFLGNSSADPCSKILKRQMADRWISANCDPASTICYVGIDWTEMHRFDDGAGGGVRPRRAADGWAYEAPLLARPLISKPDILRQMKDRGLRPPRLYERGYAHNNCRGMCVKAGQAQYELLLRDQPSFYAFNEGREQDIRAFLGADVSILTDRSGDGLKKQRFRERIEAGGQFDMFEWGGCGCFLEAAE